ncbi:MAG: MCE family protein [Actinomycetota bacterium]|nr:MCE family protein [Actinomycetota bacterium]
MPRTPFLEKTGSVRALGAGFIAVLLFFLWLTYAVFNQKFIESVPVMLTTSTAGASLPSNADVKIRGMIVGEVRDIRPTADGVQMDIAMNPEAIKSVPRDVTAEIIPKTLFGEKYIALLPSETPSGETLQAGDNISKAVVPIEVETLLNDLYPLLQAVPPAELSYTLTAVSQALEGRGEQLGQTLVTTNDYLKKVNPDVPELIDDLVKLGKVSDGYANAMPELGRLLKNVVVTGNTVVAKRSQLQAFYGEGTKLSNTLTAFLKENGDNLITLSHESRPVLEMLSDYSIVFPCVLEGVTEITPKLNSTFRDDGLHINVSLIAEADQPTGYDADENGRIPTKAEIDAEPRADPDCHTLPDSPYTHDPASNRAPVPPFEVLQLLGIKNDHNKFRTAAAAGDDALINLVQPSIDGVDSEGERSDLKALLGANLGMPQGEVPDMAALMVGPMLRGAEVTFSEAR